MLCVWLSSAQVQGLLLKEYVCFNDQKMRYLWNLDWEEECGDHLQEGKKDCLLPPDSITVL